MFDLRSVVVGVVMMLRKYTCFNITVYAQADEAEYSDGMLFLPLLGAVLGIPAFLLSLLGIPYGCMFSGAVVFIYYAVISKTSSLTDCYKTLNFYIQPKANSGQVPGITGIVAVSLLYFTLMGQVPYGALLVMQCAGFSGLLLAGFIFDRPKEGTFIIRLADKQHAASAFFISFAVAAIAGFRLVISLSVTYMIIFCAVRLVDKKIKILPESVEGLIIEATQLLFLLTTFLFKL